MKQTILNIPINEYTSPISVFADEEMSVREIMELMREKGFRHIPVLREGRPIGIISDRDLNLLGRFPADSELCAKDIMVEDPYCVYQGSSIDEVAFEMSNRKIGSALVVNNSGELEGIFTSIDGLNALIEVVRGEVESN